MMRKKEEEEKKAAENVGPAALHLQDLLLFHFLLRIFQYFQTVQRFQTFGVTTARTAPSPAAAPGGR